MKLVFWLLALIIVLSPPVASAKDLKEYGTDCEKIGFKPKTPAYGKCILELSREDVNITPQKKVEQPNVINETTNVLPAGFVRTKTLGTAGSIVRYSDRTSRLNGVGTLIWSRAENRAYWGAANAVCTASTALGFAAGTWRLPTQQELSGLYNEGTSALVTQGWTLFDRWSATTAGAGRHYVVYLDFGAVYLDIDSVDFYVTCVHEEKPEPVVLETQQNQSLPPKAERVASWKFMENNQMGALYYDENSIEQNESKITVWLYVNYNSRTPTGESSTTVRTQFECGKNTAQDLYIRHFSEKNLNNELTEKSGVLSKPSYKLTSNSPLVSVYKFLCNR